MCGRTCLAPSVSLLRCARLQLHAAQPRHIIGQTQAQAQAQGLGAGTGTQAVACGCVWVGVGRRA